LLVVGIFVLFIVLFILRGSFNFGGSGLIGSGSNAASLAGCGGIE
jgi:hypothetical protein